MTNAATTSGNVQMPPATKRYSLEAYLTREERSSRKHEFFNGIIQRMPGSKYRHNLIAANVLRLLGNAVQQLPKRYIVLNSDQKVYIPAENVALYPDALVICERPEFWNGREDLLTNPLLIVEIASRTTRDYDRGEKFLFYQRIPVFKEYVLIEQEKCMVETWYRQDVNTWRTAISDQLDNAIFLKSLDVSLDTGAIYQGVDF